MKKIFILILILCIFAPVSLANLRPIYNPSITGPTGGTGPTGPTGPIGPSSGTASVLEMSYGQMVKRSMFNNSGYLRATGEVVIIDTSVSTGSAFTVSTEASNPKVLGILLNSPGTAELGSVCVGGYTGDIVKVTGNDNIAVGDPLATSTEAGIAMKGAYATGSIIGLALEAYTTDDSAGVIKAYIY